MFSVDGMKINKDFFVLCYLTQFPDRMLTVNLYCIDINRTSECLAASFDASGCYQYQSSAVSHQHVLVSLTVFTGENLQVFQSDLSCFQPPLDEILSRIDFRKILFSVRHWLLNSVICGFWKSI